MRENMKQGIRKRRKKEEISKESKTKINAK
jgi:hypothetical protein